jgi:hypothetical protein
VLVGMWTFASSVNDVFAVGVMTRTVGSAIAGTTHGWALCVANCGLRRIFLHSARCVSVVGLMVSPDVIHELLVLYCARSVNIIVTKDILCAVLLFLDIRSSVQGMSHERPVKCSCCEVCRCSSSVAESHKAPLLMCVGLSRCLVSHSLLAEIPKFCSASSRKPC